jgi:asparagine synthase (glutamine-hydrolysing)
MCGIAGGWFPGSDVASRERLERALFTLKHRGPNDQGFESYPAFEGTVHFGHTRLSIIDLSSAGHQPMTSPSGRFSIVFNGEIYNYRELRGELVREGCRFLSDSDTEVLLLAWEHWGKGYGEDNCVRKTGTRCAECAEVRAS